MLCNLPPYELDTGDRIICWNLHLFFPTSATGENPQRKKGRGNIEADVICAADWCGRLGSLWFFARRYADYYHQLLLVAIKYFPDHPAI